MFYVIYKTTNLKSGKEYIGQHQTKNLNDNYLGSGKHLNHAIKKHGKDLFSREILFVFQTEEEMDAKEKELVTEEYCKRKDTYNICPGGFGGGFRFINTNTELRNGFEKTLNDPQVFTKVVEGAKTASKITSEKWKNDSEWREDTIEKISFSMKEKVQKDGHWWSNRKHTDETKAKISFAAKNRKINSQSGTMWITNGTENRKMKVIDIIPEGWYKGRKMN